MPVREADLSRAVGRIPRRRLLEYVRARYELGIRDREDPLAIRKFSDKQLGFLNAPQRFRLYEGGNQSGKTTVLVAEVAHAALGFRPYLLPNLRRPTLEVDLQRVPRHARWNNGANPPRPVRIPSQGLIVAEGYDSGIGEVVLPKLREWCAPYIKREIKGTGGSITGIEWKNGSTTRLGSYIQGEAKFRGAVYDYVACDEPPPREVYIELRRSVIVRSGRIWLALTPWTEPWIDDEIYSKAAAGDPDYYAERVTFFDNPWRNPDADWIRSLTDEEAECRIFGRPRHLSGLVYKEWNRDVHTCEPFEIPPDWPRWHVVDPHDRKPMAMIWAAVSPANEVFIYRESPADRPFEHIRDCTLDVAGYAELIKEFEKGEMIQFRVMDPAFGPAPKGVTRTSIADEFALQGLYFDTSVSNKIEPGHLKVKSYLRYDRAQPLSAMNRPRISIFNTLRNVIWSFEHYVYGESKGWDKGLKEKPREVGKDFMDCIRYFCMAEPTFRYAVQWNRTGGNVGSYGYGR